MNPFRRDLSPGEPRTPEPTATGTAITTMNGATAQAPNADGTLQQSQQFQQGQPPSDSNTGSSEIQSSPSHVDNGRNEPLTGSERAQTSQADGGPGPALLTTMTTLNPYVDTQQLLGSSSNPDAGGTSAEQRTRVSIRSRIEASREARLTQSHQQQQQQAHQPNSGNSTSGSIRRVNPFSPRDNGRLPRLAAGGGVRPNGYIDVPNVPEVPPLLRPRLPSNSGSSLNSIQHGNSNHHIGSDDASQRTAPPPLGERAYGARVLRPEQVRSPNSRNPFSNGRVRNRDTSDATNGKPKFQVLPPIARPT